MAENARTNEVEIANLESLLAAVAYATHHNSDDRQWWRGHCRSDWKLLPRLYGDGHAPNEANLAHRFRNQARSRHYPCPDLSDLGAWLALMRHYGLPTRLLDWSDSPLIALFFAVESTDHNETAAAVWGLNPAGWNNMEMGEPRLYGMDSPKTRGMVREAFDRSIPRTSLTAAIEPSEVDLRHLVQQSKFTLHGSVQPMEANPAAKNHLVKLVIPAEKKALFRDTLSILGISESTLFPDLEHLASSLKRSRYSSI